MKDRAATPDAPIELTRDQAPETAPPAPAEDGATSEPALDPASQVSPPVAVPPPALEERVQRLEEQVAVLQDTHKVEDRITERLARRMERKLTNPAIQPPVAAIAQPSRPPPVAAIAPPPELPPVIVLEGKGVRQSWLFLDIYTEFRAMLGMFLDPRYRVFYMTWQTKVYPPLLLACMVLTWLTISSIPIVGPVLEKVAELVLAFFLYKVLSREAWRYREIRSQMKPFGHK
jgi:hypothetical protein